jgi:microcystin-dependent protein
MPIHAGQGNGLSNYPLGQMAGEETVALPTASLPQADPDAAPSQNVAAKGGEAHNNMQPYLALNYIIALEGIFLRSD